MDMDRCDRREAERPLSVPQIPAWRKPRRIGPVPDGLREVIGKVADEAALRALLRTAIERALLAAFTAEL